MLERRTQAEKPGVYGVVMVGDGKQRVSPVLVEESSSATLRQWGERSSSVKWPNVIENVQKLGLNAVRPPLNSEWAGQPIGQLNLRINEPVEFWDRDSISQFSQSGPIVPSESLSVRIPLSITIR
jgi:hypothetical protein